MTRKRLGVRIAAATAVVAGAVALTLVAGGAKSSADQVRLDHGGTASRAQLDRVLNAVAAAGAGATRAELEARGEALFNSASVAKSGESCVSCHIVGGGVNAPLGFITHGFPGGDPSLNDFKGIRDAPALWDVGRTAPYNWVGSNKTLEDQVVAAVTTHFTQTANDARTAEDVAAIAAYLRTIRAPTTRHDQGRLTPAEVHGEEIFVGKGGCIVCHGGPQFTDNQIHNTNVPQVNMAPIGQGTDPGSKSIPGGFNTPQLRDVRNTAPYMHNGVLATLEDVVDFYNSNPSTGGPLRLTGPEKANLVAYLKTL